MKTAKYYENVYKTGMVPLEEIIQSAMDDVKNQIEEEKVIYANQKLVEFVNWLNNKSNTNIHIPNSWIGQFNLSQNEKLKYWHEATSEERKAFIESGANTGQLMATYKQPDWCKYPEALSWQMGCWSLCDSETKVNYDFCKTCEECMHYEFKKPKSKTLDELSVILGEDLFNKTVEGIKHGHRVTIGKNWEHDEDVFDNLCENLGYTPFFKTL